jgi:hypothetical protein
VRNSFTKLRHALDLREKLLLRQIEVLNSAPDNNKIAFAEISFQTEAETEALELLRNYGAYQNIDCYLPYLENENEHEGMLYEKSFDPNSIDNKKLSESIINLTLRESQNLITRSTNLVTSVGDKLKLDPSKVIDKSPPPSNEGDSASIKQKSDAKVKQQQADDSKLKRNDVTTSSKKKTLKNISNLTLNNCGGSIILKNISNLTINTCKQASPKVKDIPVPLPAKPCTTSKSCDGTFYQCDFYERLISENEVLKRSIVNQSLCTTTYPDPIAQTCMSPSVSKHGDDRDDGTYSISSAHGDTTTTSSIMEEAEDGLPAAKTEKIEEITTRTMMTDNLMKNHPPMIQCWLNKMLLETETESQNITEFLEISNIM